MAGWFQCQLQVRRLVEKALAGRDEFGRAVLKYWVDELLGGTGMLKPLDRHRRDSTLFQFTTRRLRDFVDPDHLLIRIDEQFDFSKLVTPLEERYCPDNGRPAIHPEVMIRALLICSLYNISSFRRLSSAIAENIAYRWFCFFTIDDPCSTTPPSGCFIERIGREGFSDIFQGLNEELLRLGLLSPEMYADSSLVKANVSSHQLSRSGLTVEEFREQAPWKTACSY